MCGGRGISQSYGTSNVPSLSKKCIFISDRTFPHRGRFTDMSCEQNSRCLKPLGTKAACSIKLRPFSVIISCLMFQTCLTHMHLWFPANCFVAALNTLTWHVSGQHTCHESWLVVLEVGLPWTALFRQQLKRKSMFTWCLCNSLYSLGSRSL